MGRFAAALAALLFALPHGASARDLADDLTVQMYAKPAGDRFHVLVRVSFRALNGVDLPSRGANGELDLARAAAVLPSAARWWIAGNLELYEGDARLPRPEVIETRVSLPSDNAFASYEDAWAHLTGPSLPNEAQLFWDQAMLDVLFDYPIHSGSSNFAIHSSLSRLGVRVSTHLRFLPPDGADRTFEYQGDPGLIALDPLARQAVRRFVPFGFFQVLKGTDYLLFLFCVALQLRSVRALIPFAAAFTVAHPVTLIASASNLVSDALWFPVLIETLAAVSIVYLAFESIAFEVTAGDAAARREWAGRRWILAFGFGLIYGFGLSFALKPALQFAGSHVLASAVWFNAGVELGQLLVWAVLIPALGLLFRAAAATTQRIETIILAALAADTGWHRVTERAERLSQFSFAWPTFDAALLASGMRWLTIFLALGGLASLVVAVLRHRASRAAPREKAKDGDDSDAALSSRPGL